MKMTTAKFRNIATYGAIGIAIYLLMNLGDAIQSGLMPGFMDGQTFAPSRERIADLIELITAAGAMWLAANRPRFGSERLAADVKALQADGVSRQDMTVVTKEDAKILKDEAARIREFKQRLDEKRMAQRG